MVKIVNGAALLPRSRNEIPLRKQVGILSNFPQQFVKIRIISDLSPLKASAICTNLMTEALFGLLLKMAFQHIFLSIFIVAAKLNKWLKFFFVRKMLNAKSLSYRCEIYLDTTNHYLY